jgi:hypothetical protein
MSETFTYKVSEQTALARSKRLREAGQVADVAGGTTSYSGSGSSTAGVTDHGQLSGIFCTDDEYAAGRKDIHLTSAAADKIKSITEDGMFLRKDIDDTANGNITFVQSIHSSLYVAGMNTDGAGWNINADGTATFGTVNARNDIFLNGKIGTSSFESGFTGSGWQINGSDCSAQFDYLTVRKSMKVYELVYSQIYGLGGSVLVTDLNKIKSVSVSGSTYTCTIDTMDGDMHMNLRVNDVIRVQRSEGLNIRYYYGKITSVSTSTFNMTILSGSDTPATGDVVFRMGNTSDTTRQGLLYLTSSDSNSPYLDILDGVTSSTFSGKTKVRIGNLAGLTVNGTSLSGYGIYIKGGIYENCTYYLSDGKTIEQRFTTVDGVLDSTIKTTDSDAGNKIISRINQTATTATISASHIYLTGVVTFSMFNSSLQSTINGKANSSDLGSLASLDSVGLSNLNSTVISGNKILTSIIDTDAIFAKMAKIGGFTINSDSLSSTFTPSDGYGLSTNIHLYSTASAAFMIESGNQSMRLGLTVLDPSAGYNCMMYIKDNSARTGASEIGYNKHGIDLIVRGGYSNCAMSSEGGMAQRHLAWVMNSSYDIVNYYKYYNNFVINGNGVTTIYLPSYVADNTFDTEFNQGYNDSFVIDITTTVNVTTEILIRTRGTNTYINRGNANTLDEAGLGSGNVGSFKMNRCDHVRLLYYGLRYYMISDERSLG